MRNAEIWTKPMSAEIQTKTEECRNMDKTNE